MLRRSIAGFFVLLPVCLLAQTDPMKPLEITLHVTSVSQQPDSTACGDEPDCQATDFTVEGYADSADKVSRTEYVLGCVETWSGKPTLNVAVSCGSIHASNEYRGRVLGNTISFWPA